MRHAPTRLPTPDFQVLSPADQPRANTTRKPTKPARCCTASCPPPPPNWSNPPDDAVTASRPNLVPAAKQMTSGPLSKGEGSQPPSSASRSASQSSPPKSISFQVDTEPEPSQEPTRSPATQQDRDRDPLDDDDTPRKEVGPASPAVKDGQGRAGKLVETTEPRDSQRQLNEYRENLARVMERREAPPPRGGQAPAPGPMRVSPIQEENSPSSLPQLSESSDPTTTSTESGHTIRGSATPGPMAGTPSYPFPRMASSTFLPPAVHRPFTTLSPTVPPDGTRPLPEPFSFRGQDTLVSNPSTPASNLTFLPPGCSHEMTDHRDFPSPNLYELALMLAAEPGLDAWWHTVVQIMVDVYKAERVTLAIPADSTDIENVPWGQKATYNAHGEDHLSLGYLARGSSLVPSSNDETSVGSVQAGETPRPPEMTRPGLQSRHSFTAYETNRRTSANDRLLPASLRRPHLVSRSKSHHPHISLDHDLAHDDDNTLTSLNQEALEQHDAQEGGQEIPSWEAPFTAPRKGHGKVLNVLQALDYEADPLIDHNGVLRILERGRVVALTRTYPYLNQDESGEKKPWDARAAAVAKSPEGQRKKLRKPRSDSLSKLSALLSSASLSSASTRASKPQPPERKPTMSSRIEDEAPRPPTPKYEEYEQAPPSPWSQSPAPSPAVRADPTENPFFTDAMVDEESFNPSSAPADYSTLVPPEAIGVDNSWTVLHIPLSHVLLSKPNPSFRLDPSLMEQKMSARKAADPLAATSLSPERPVKEKHAPIAILSILSPMIPYPSNLRHSLEHLAPHLATSFSLCRHYTNLETELNGLQKRRPQTAGFGALGPDGRPLADPTALASLAYLPAEEVASRDSLAGSMTSPSDYSAPSRSTAGSPSGTPGWEPSSLKFVMDKRGPTSSPSPVTADSYFSSVPKSPANTGQRVRRNSREASTSEKRSSLRLSGGKAQLHDATSASPAVAESRRSFESVLQDSEDSQSTGAQQRRPPSNERRDQGSGEKGGALAVQGESHKRHAGAASSTPHRHHTQLHSYGADFASTFQSLPPSSTIARGVNPHSAAVPSRTGSIAQTEMTPPSDKLKGLILDSLPAHVFVALPQTGEIVWVNSRFLTYRGQTSGDLAADPWGSIHPDDREEYLRAWSHFRTGEQFSRTHVAEIKLKTWRPSGQHRLLANLIPQIIFTATEDEGITFANEQWLSYTGQSVKEPLGLVSWTIGGGRGSQRGLSRHSSSSSSGSGSNDGTTYDLPTANLTELARKGVIKVSTDSSGRLSYTTEIRLRSKSGEYRWHLIRCVEIDNVDFGNGESSYFGSATDINDLKLLETKLKEAMDSKGRFLSNMSHEIRTPLIGISGMVSFLQDTTLNEEQRDYTNTIQTSANSLLMIINDILDLSKVDAGMMKLSYEWFHTRSLIEDVNELVSTMAIAKRLELNYVVEEDVPAWVKGDKVRIRQVLLNVIGNAIKFTSQGEVFSKCRVVCPEGVRLQPDEIMLEFSIIDTGRGFTKEEADLIFKPFSQIDGSSTRQHGGSGLGLVISRQLVELHGGRMEGTAVPGKGSTFTFTARFGLPTDDDHPDASEVPQPTPGLVQNTPLVAAQPPLVHVLPGPVTDSPSTTDPGFTSPAAVSSGSSELSSGSSRTRVTDRSSMSSVNAGLVRFSQAARASGQDLSQMKLEMPSPKSSSAGTTPTASEETDSARKSYVPPMFSILIICPQTHSREATTKHIEMTLPKDIPHQITAVASVDEAETFIRGEESVRFTHIVVNLPSPEEVISLMDKLLQSESTKLANTTVLILSDSVQRQGISKLAANTQYEDILSDNKVTYIYKPVKPSRFAVIFDPAKERDLSIDHNRSTAQRLVEDQRQSYVDMERRMGGKGYKVLLVEDNPVNQKVLQKYLKRVGVAVELAADGVECTDMVFAKGWGYYALILCDLHMPRKDGYQACREVRAWEAQGGHAGLPIIALSANVMSDVQEKCVEAGFNDYVTKPVDFIDLSRALSKFF
ncbi:hypothetical protein NEMBOFW57_009861 [Staphylotrichum longicolle]|uniref:histidine kinase n=1 Tax=Staphylotrichum longicolle TaxID=669026 RepID=A0AAD4HWC3_9PEZI|nr:hypothetical protein NEMBOFW57_009861 [Staphylotrichum longicolle]